jgi:signal transduction histidine kinase
MKKQGRTLKALIQSPVRTGVWVVSAAILIITSLVTVISVRETNAGIERLLIYSTESIANAALGNQELLQIQRELNQLDSSILAAFDVNAKISLYVGNLLVGQTENTLNLNWFSSHLNRSFTGPGGKTISLELDVDHSGRIAKWAAFLFLLQVIIFFIFYSWRSKMADAIETVTQPLHETVDWTQSIIENLDQLDLKVVSKLPTSSIDEIERLSNAMNRLVEEIKTLQHKIKQSEFERGRFEMAAQVAHDIRSPLTSLLSFLHQSHRLDEESRIQVKSAVTRIRDIANNLLIENKPKTISLNNVSPNSAQGTKRRLRSEEPASDQLLSFVIDSIVSEKRLQLNAKQGIQIDANLDFPYGIFSHLQPIEFGRLLSNIINNAIESIIAPSGRVSIQLNADDHWAEVTISDNGKGMSAQTLKRIGERGFSDGKHSCESGSGLGVYHARNTIESWGGELRYESEVGRGTVAIIRLPRSVAPNWFTSKLCIPKDASIVVIDDDSNIHGIWRSRIKDLKNISEFIQFQSPDELIKWYRQKHGSLSNSLFLCDYEFTKDARTGLDIIDMLGIASESILVTSRAEDPGLREKCEKKGIRVLPKELAVSVPISEL